MIEFLQRFPKDIFQGSILAFLSSRDVSNLDLAVLVKIYRPYFLEQLAGAVLDDYVIYFCDCAWATSRRVSYRKIVFKTDLSVISTLNDQQLSALLRSTQSVSIYKCLNTGISIQSFQRLLTCCIRLLDVTYMETDSYGNRFFEGNFNQDGCHATSSSSIMDNICDLYPQLQSLSITSEDAVLFYVIARSLRALPRLHTLCLSMTGRFAQKMNVIPLEIVNTALRKLSLIRYVRLPGSAMVMLIEHLPKLTHLNITMCTQLEDSTLQAIAANLPHLVELKAGFLPNLTDSTLIALGKHSKDLQCVHFENNMAFTDEGVTSLAVGCTRLRDVCLRKCVNITNKSLVSFANNCADLTFLDIKGCDHVLWYEVRTMQREYLKRYKKILDLTSKFVK